MKKFFSKVKGALKQSEPSEGHATIAILDGTPKTEDPFAVLKRYDTGQSIVI